MKGCGKAANFISQEDIEWFYQISPAGLAIERKNLRMILQDKNIPIESKRKVKAAFPELSDHEFSIKDRLVRTTPSTRLPLRTNPSFRLPIVVHGDYNGMSRDEGQSTIQGKQYFISKYDLPQACHLETRVQFHNVTFVFPSGLFLPVPSGGRFVNPIFEFADGSTERTSVSEQIIDGGTRFQGVFTGGNKVTTVLSNHLHPQAGVTVWRDSGMIKLLVSVD